MYKIILMSLAASAFITFMSTEPTRAADICSLLTQKEAAELIQAKVQEGQVSQGMMPAGPICTYLSLEGDASLKYKLSSDKDIKEEGLFDSAADIITRQRKARRNATISGVTLDVKKIPGDDTLWDGSNLWVVSGDTLLLVTVVHRTEQTFTDMAEMRKELRKERRQCSIKAAEIILERTKE